MADRRVVSESTRRTTEEQAWNMVEKARENLPDWGVAARCWLKWIRRDSRSWNNFVEWLIENEVDVPHMWDSFAQISNDYLCMSQDWVAADERDEYLALCADAGAEQAMD